jgi:hypothetical protein
MKNMHKTLLTKLQVQTILASWKVVAEVPKKNEKLVVALPNEHLNVAKITWNEEKGTYGERLYQLVMYREGT